MHDVRDTPLPRTATVVLFPSNSGPARPVVALAQTLELYAKAFPTKAGMLTLLQGWLFVAERDGVALRQPAYAEALRRAISALNFSLSVPHAIALLRLQEATSGQIDSAQGGHRE